jgi:hypothetical protein
VAGAKTRFRYRREQANGTVNDSISLKAFEGWLKEAQPGDRFFVAQCRWVQCEPDGNDEFPHVRWVAEAEPVEN